MKFCHLFSLAGLLQISFWWQTHGNWLHTTSRLLSLLILFSGTLRYSFTLWVLPSGRKWRSICKNRCSECVPIWGRLHRWGRHWRPTSCRHHCAGDWECPMETPPPPPLAFSKRLKIPWFNGCRCSLVLSWLTLPGTSVQWQTPAKLWAACQLNFPGEPRNLPQWASTLLQVPPEIFQAAG